MHVGMTTFFQNLSGLPDEEVYAHELSMADLAEPLGFESIWAAEHHFSGYTMCPSVIQFLTYMAGRTKHAKLGSMVMVLPWHNPVRVAEELSVLDQMSRGRVMLGVGRGLGRVEFEGFGFDMNESRERFVEYSEAILESLETGVMEYDGKLFKQPRVEIRPNPYASFKGRVYAAAASPESAAIMARLGVGIMIIAQKPWERTVAELDNYREIYREVNNGAEPPKPLLVSFMACHEDSSIADEMHKTYLRGYSQSALDHYEFANPNLGNIKGYEYYGAMAKSIAKHGTDPFVNMLADLQVWGTPEQCYQQCIENCMRIDGAGIIAGFSYAGMPPELAKENMKLFADKVLPRLKAFETQNTIAA
jgi:alkanesulfonate monooxygenase SsuD/methylene tetrahydromethanopterin reductase-like flavin-dependent oxidoreductase (luciferase family)